MGNDDAFGKVRKMADHVKKEVFDRLETALAACRFSEDEAMRQGCIDGAQAEDHEAKKIEELYGMLRQYNEWRAQENIKAVKWNRLPDKIIVNIELMPFYCGYEAGDVFTPGSVELIESFAGCD